MLEKLKKQFILMTIVAMMAQLMVVRATQAYNAGSVVINEVAWAGSSESSTDEWIELYNTTTLTVDLSGWEIFDDGESTVVIGGDEAASGSAEIGPHGYFLIEDNESAVDGVTADLVASLSLANSGDSLALKDSSGVLIDSVNSSGGAWYAGNSANKISMEKIDPGVFDDIGANWASANGVTGTPRNINSNYAGGGPEVSLKKVGGNEDEVVFVVEVDEVTNLYAYGFDVNYDPEVLSFVEAEEDEFLDQDGTSTAFNAAKENGQEGTVVVGNARLINPAEGISGSGELFEISFEIVGEADETVVSFGAGSFLTDEVSDIPAKFNSFELKLGQTLVSPVSGLKIAEDEERYSLRISWETVSGSSGYVVRKLEANGTFVTLGETSGNFWVDNKNILPQINYKYQILAVQDGVLSIAKEISGVESRGIVGDFDKSDRVDGHDIEKLARTYGLEYADEDYDPLVDSNFDGVIDGSDLIDVGVNFAMSY